MKPKFFSTAEKFRTWLEKDHDKKDELLVGFWKIGSGKPSMTWSESVDQALCFGWIDGVRKRIDDESYTIRFTPRRAGSVWSKVNIDKVEELTKQGLMRKAGSDAFEKRRADRSAIYAYENRPKEIDAVAEKKFKQENAAWKFFDAQPPGYKRLMIFWVMSAKQQATRDKRLDQLIAASREEKRIT